MLDQLVDGDAIVPAVSQLEVTNALLDAEWHGRLSEAQAERLIALLDQLPIIVSHAADDPAAVHAAAHRHRLSAYQASYLVLAQRLGVPLATTDPALANAARLAGTRLASGV